MVRLLLIITLFGMTGGSAWAEDDHSFARSEAAPSDAFRHDADPQRVVLAESKYNALIQTMSQRLSTLSNPQATEARFAELDKRVPADLRQIVFTRIIELSSLNLSQAETARLQYAHHLLQAKARIRSSLFSPQLAALAGNSIASSLLGIADEIPRQPASVKLPARAFRAFPRY